MLTPKVTSRIAPSVPPSCSWLFGFFSFACATSPFILEYQGVNSFLVTSHVPFFRPIETINAMIPIDIVSIKRKYIICLSIIVPDQSGS